jgi:hypothetical protein
MWVPWSAGRRLSKAFLVIAILMGGLVGIVAAQEVDRISVEELKTRRGEPGLIILDVRAPDDWRGSDRKIPGARREDPGKVNTWADSYSREAEIILYCD